MLGVAGLATGMALLTVAGILLGLGGGALVGIDLANKGVEQDRLAELRRELHERRVQIERIDAELAALPKPGNG